MSVTLEADQLHIEVSDLGPGFDWNHDQLDGEHLGLEGMRQRVESIGGTFRIQSGIGQGTHVLADLPVDGEVGEHVR